MDWTLFQKQSECEGPELYKGFHYHLYQCAESCREISTIFAFGTDEFDYKPTDPKYKSCDVVGCKCFCQTAATSEGSCTEKSHLGYNLYAFKQKNIGK